MNKRRLSTVLLAASIALVLLSIYMAVMFAPVPQTSVKAAGEAMPSIDGAKIRVAGFVAEVFFVQTPPLNQDGPRTVTFSLADFRDYERYLSANESGQLDTTWWTVRPIDIVSHSGAPFSGSSFVDAYITPGTNLSVEATVHAAKIGPDSNVTGYSLSSSDGGDFTIGGPASAYSVLTAPVAQKIFYFHMPSAWVAYLSFGTTLIGSAMYLRTKKQKFDDLAFSSAEIGIVFATIAILTGPIWAKQEWGVYWRWDDVRLVTTFIMWLVYIGYLMLRAALSEPHAKARVSAVYGLLGFVAVPLSFLSSRVAPLMRSSHPQVIATGSGSLSPAAGMAVGIAVVAFTVLFITMLIKRMEIAESEEELEEIKRRAGGEE